jgi:hypothetical protein
LIVTRGGELNPGLSLDFWEDQMSIYNADGTDEGYCTLIGDIDAPPACPLGTIAKVFSGGAMACLRVCASDAECERPEYVCDQRYLDLLDSQLRPQASCVRRCSFDVPDCVRTGVIENPAAPGQLIFTLATPDMTGFSTCSSSGHCATIEERTGGSGPGEPCASSDDCDAGAVCYQGGLLAALVGAADGPGFCASPCYPALGADACTVGYSCQEAGVLALGYPNFVMTDPTTGDVSQAGGFCFFRCENGVAGNCNTVPQSACGQINEATLEAEWNGSSMCLPDSVRQ